MQQNQLLEQLLDPNNWSEVFLRLALALIFGGIIGWERESRNKPAGLRTHMLVSLGSALFVLVSIQVGAVLDSSDVLGRVIQGVAAGIGFLGGGEILREPATESDRYRIRGLTSAAAIWISASLGITAACGLWEMGLMTTLMAWLVLRVFKVIEPSERR